MVMQDLIEKYWGELPVDQQEKLMALVPLYKDWNAKINVISRKDIDNVGLHHILHASAIQKYIKFKKGSKILDFGTGGGFPGIPMAIMNPECEFLLVDSIAKKLKVVKDVVEKLDLKNVQTKHERVENLKEKFDFIICRAVSRFENLIPWTRKLVSNVENNPIPNGMIALKGGDISSELKYLKKKHYYEVTRISEYFDEAFFEEKYIIYLQY